MKGVLFLRPEAEQDLATARDWYDQQRAGLGDEFLDAMALALRVLARDPELPRLYYRNFRRVMLRRFPYIRSSATASSSSASFTRSRSMVVIYNKRAARKGRGN